MCVCWWLWNKIHDEETKLMANTNHKVAENELGKAEKQQLSAIARAADEASANKKAAQTWGQCSTDAANRDKSPYKNELEFGIS